MRNRLVLGAAFVAGGLLVALVLGQIITAPGDLQQRDLYVPWFVDRVIESTVYPLWSPQSTLNIAGPGRLPLTLALVGAVRALGVDDAVFGRLLVLWVAFVGYTGTFVAYLLFARGGRRRRPGADAIGAMVAGSVFVINPWTIAQLEHVWMLAPWALMPLAVALAAEASRTGRRRWAVISAAGMAVFGVTQPHYLAFTGILVALWVLGFAPARRGLRARALDLAVWVGVVGVVGTFFWAPYLGVLVHGGRPNPAYTLMDQTLSIAQFQDLPNSLLGSANFNWRDAVVPAGPERLAWMLAGWLIALLPLVALVWRRHRRAALYLAGAGYGAALIATAAIWPPTSDLYLRVVADVPGGWLWRGPDKLGGVVAWSQAMAAGVVVATLIRTRLGLGARILSWAPRVGLAGYVIFATGVHAQPSVASLLWDAGARGYVPAVVPADYRWGLTAIDADAGPSGRVLVASSNERTPRWDPRRILRMIEPLSLATPSVAGDTRSPVPPAPVQGRWFEWFDAADPQTALAAARRLGFSHVLVVRDYPAGARAAAGLASASGVTVLVDTPNLWGGRVAAKARPRIAAAQPLVVTGLDTLPPVGGATLLANHTGGLKLPDGLGLAAASEPAAADLAFARLRPDRLVSVTPWFGTRGRSDRWIWGEAYADERQSWLRELDRAGLASWAADYGLGIALAPPGDLAEPLTVDLGQHGNQRAWLRVFTSPRSSHIDIETGQTSLRVPTRSDRSEWRWVALGEVSTDRLTIVPGPGFEAVNAVALPPAGWSPQPQAGVLEFVVPEVTFTRDSASGYTAEIRGAAGFAFVILREGFDPVWRATSRAAVYGPFLTDGLWNGYIVRLDGPTEVRFSYAAARWYDAGIAISLAAVALLAGVPAVLAARRKWGRPDEPGRPA